ncbi:MAG: DUF2520 domain-containing protein [Bacteroidetes bacterium]|jgi:predicted short-subunit dehydrogenase-like oxidoreductase (DUF2520 family)|nr:DUF2520 domain-containing protein [Bacteroidota bacterium]
MISDVHTISVIGPGALGGTLIDLVRQSSENFQLTSVWGSSFEACYLEKNGKKIPPSSPVPTREEELGSVVFITCPDDIIEAVAKELADLPLDWGARSVVHFSGSHGSALLEELSRKGASTGALHPLQTFTPGDQAPRLSRIWFTYEGNERVIPTLKKFVEEAGSQIKKLDITQKMAMHLAAVFASNYLVSLLHSVEEISRKNSVENSLEMLEPLIRQTVDNVLNHGAEQALSGPVMRGDLSTLREHLQLLDDDPGLASIYCSLGLQALAIADSAGSISQQTSDEIKKLLNSKRE